MQTRKSFFIHLYIYTYIQTRSSVCQKIEAVGGVVDNGIKRHEETWEVTMGNPIGRGLYIYMCWREKCAVKRDAARRSPAEIRLYVHNLRTLSLCLSAFSSFSAISRPLANQLGEWISRREFFFFLYELGIILSIGKWRSGCIFLYSFLFCTGFYERYIWYVLGGYLVIQSDGYWQRIQSILYIALCFLKYFRCFLYCVSFCIISASWIILFQRKSKKNLTNSLYVKK